MPNLKQRRASALAILRAKISTPDPVPSLVQPNKSAIMASLESWDVESNHSLKEILPPEVLVIPGKETFLVKKDEQETEMDNKMGHQQPQHMASPDAVVSMAQNSIIMEQHRTIDYFMRAMTEKFLR